MSEQEQRRLTIDDQQTIEPRAGDMVELRLEFFTENCSETRRPEMVDFFKVHCDLNCDGSHTDYDNEITSLDFTCETCGAEWEYHGENGDGWYLLKKERVDL